MSRWSLPTVAVVLGALDSFNPCAFFVLLFLLSLLVNARSRARMLLVGGLFVLVMCTAGFPMVFTRILTLHALSPAAYYGYIGLYCAVYVVPLLIIVMLFVATLGRHKLSERQGRILKLVSGIMMLSLGVLLLVDPALLSSIGVTLGLLAGVLTLSWLIVRFAPVGPSPADR